MVKYDFTKHVNRTKTGSAKWDQMLEWNPNVSDGVIPYSVADIDMETPEEIREGLKQYIDKYVLGYTLPKDSYFEAVIGWMKRRHNWNIKKEWVVLSPGVVTAIYNAIKAFTDPGDGVIVMRPVYYPFLEAINNTGRELVSNSLIKNGSSYSIDFEDLSQKAKNPKNKLLIFCSPHNPVGRVWTRQELEEVGRICLGNDVLIVSDEIHFDLIMPGHKHTVFATLSDEIASNVIVCTAPSKTFNLAGLQTSNIIIPNDKIREKYEAFIENDGFFTVNIFGPVACEIAYNNCEYWIDSLVELIYKNHLELKRFISENIPEIEVFDLQGTYLQWMDFSKFNLDKGELERVMHMESQVFFDEGYVFGSEGNGFERMNIACPTDIMLEGLIRVQKVLKK